MLGNIGPTEICVVLVIALLVFGPKKLPELGRSLGKGINEFTRSVSGHDDGEPEIAAKIADGGEATVPAAAHPRAE